MSFFLSKEYGETSGSPAATGDVTGWSDNYSQAYDAQRRLHSMYALEHEYADLDAQNASRIKTLTGQDFDLSIKPDSLSVARLGTQASGVSRFSEYLDVARSLHNNEPLSGKWAEEESRLEELKKQYPEIKTRRELFEDLRKMAADLKSQSGDVSERQTTGGAFGEFFGSMFGSFTQRDPFNLATLGVGGGGKTIATRILAEAGVNSAIETVNQVTGVSENTELMGIPTSSSEMLANIAFAGAGAGLFRGVGEGGGVVYKAIRSKQAKLQKMSAKELIAEIDAIPNQSPDVRAIRNSLELEDDMVESLGLDRDPIGYKKHLEALDEIDSILDSMPAGFERFDYVPSPKSSEVAEAFSRGDDYLVQKARDVKEQMIAASDIDVNPNKAASISKFIGEPVISLSQFIKTKGGLSDADGELAARDIRGKSLPGMIRKKGEQLDLLKKMAVDEGYFPNARAADDITNSEFMDAIANDISGAKIIPHRQEMLLREKIAEAGTTKDRYAASGLDESMDLDEIARVISEDFGAPARLEDFDPDTLASMFPDEMSARVMREREALDNFLRNEDQTTELNYVELQNKLNDDYVVYYQDIDGSTIQKTFKEIMDDIESDEQVAEIAGKCLV